MLATVQKSVVFLWLSFKKSPLEKVTLTAVFHSQADRERFGWVCLLLVRSRRGCLRCSIKVHTNGANIVCGVALNAYRLSAVHLWLSDEAREEGLASPSLTLPLLCNKKFKSCDSKPYRTQNRLSFLSAWWTIHWCACSSPERFPPNTKLIRSPKTQQDHQQQWQRFDLGDKIQ